MGERSCKFLILILILFQSYLFASDFSLSLVKNWTPLNQSSLINQNNLFGTVDSFTVLSLKSVSSYVLSEQLDFSSNVTLQKYDHPPNSQIDSTRILIDSLMLNWRFSDQWSIECGKNPINFGNSIFENIWNMTSSSFDKRVDEGAWSFTTRYRKDMTNLSLSILPSDGLGESAEWKNRNTLPRMQLQYDALSGDIDFRTILSSNLNSSLSPFLAASVSSPLPFNSKIIVYIDTKIVNYDTKMTLSQQTSNNWQFGNPEIPALFSPTLVGISTTFWSQLDVRMEYIYNFYGLNNQESQQLFDALSASSTNASSFASNYRNNTLGQHYINVSGTFPFLLDGKMSCFGNLKSNLTDGSAISRFGISFLPFDGFSLDFGVAIPIFSTNRSEFGSYPYQSEVKISSTYSYQLN